MAEGLFSNALNRMNEILTISAYAGSKREISVQAPG